MKRILAVSLTALMILASVFAQAAPEATAKGNGKLSVVATIFPEYDWVREVLGSEASNVELTLLLDSGVDLHSFQPTVNDIMKISTCDLFIYVGGESDEWVEDVLLEATNKNMKTINLLEVLGEDAKEEELVEGMEGEEEEEGEGEEEEIEYDEHVWLSLKNAQIYSTEIAQALGELDPSHASAYLANAQAYNAKLAALDAKYDAAVDAASCKTILFGDRFPFRYMVDDYGIDYYAAFVGCSAETEASFETIVFLANKVDELGLKAICVIENSDKRIAQTVSQSTVGKNQKILTLDSMQSVTAKDVANGTTYLSIMENNLSVLSEALN